MNEIAYQNKDITSKIFAEKFKGKSLKVYGIHVPDIIEVLPTNLPAIQANELRIDKRMHLYVIPSSLQNKFQTKKPKYLYYLVSLYFPIK